MRDQVLEVRNVDGRLHIARKPGQYDEWDPYVPPYDPYGPGAKVIDDAGDKFADDCNLSCSITTIFCCRIALSTNSFSAIARAALYKPSCWSPQIACARRSTAAAGAC